MKKDLDIYSSTIKNILSDPKKLFQLASIAFSSVCRKGSEVIDEEELGKVLVEFSQNLGGEPPTPEDVREVMRHLDTDNSNTIDLNEFTMLVKDVLYAMLEKV